MPKWEYKIVTSTDSDEDDETMLNELGEDGWELVSVHVSEVTYVDASEESDDEEEGEEYVEEVVSYYLKRGKAA
jgi:predicted metal-dependent RNase